MDQQRLRELLGQLHTELAQGGETLDPRNRELLEAVRGDLERATAVPVEGGEAPGVSANETHEVHGRLQQAIVSFEASHPQLAAGLEQLANGLSNMGL